MTATSVVDRPADALDSLRIVLTDWQQRQRASAWILLGTSSLSTPGAAACSSLVRRVGELALITDGAVRSGRRGQILTALALRRPFPLALVVQANARRALPLAQSLRDALEDGPMRLAQERDPWLTLLCSSPSLERPLRLLRRVAGTPLSVLLLGETGCGKEELTRALHLASQRPGALIAESCAALPESLLEAEMFGVRRGAFTGAETPRKGRVVEAHRGTLFLDEIGELPSSIQVKLLRVLQEREVRPLGGDPVRVDIRVVAATHRDLPRLVEREQFRSDLYFRLAGAVVYVPPLRERLGDIPYLAATLLARARDSGIGPGTSLAPAVLHRLGQHSFRGNVRELDNMLRQAAALANGPRILPQDLPLPEPHVTSRPHNLEVKALSEALFLAGGVKADAARRLGWSRQKLYRRMAALGMLPPSVQ